MINLFISYFRHTCPEVFAGGIDGELEKAIDYRSLPTVATLPLDLELPEHVAARVSTEKLRVQRYQALERQLKAVTDGAAAAIKGSIFSAFYPLGVLRYQGDLDLLVPTEGAYIRCVEKLLQLGLVQRSSHLTLARDGKHYASTIFFEPLDNGLPGPASIYVELHLRGFPISPLSYLDMTSANFLELSENNQNSIIYLAEITHRFAKFGHFTHRDVLDAILLFSRLGIHDEEPLRNGISDNELWVSVSLLSRHLRHLKFPGLPKVLAELITDRQAATVPQPYDIFEHQAWPFCRRQGMSREEYEYIYRSYGEINVPAGHSFSLTPFEVGLRFGRGVPVVMQITPTPEREAILDSCILFAGPQDARVPVHQRIGDDPPNRPQ